MVRRSSSNRWSRPATVKQIATLKAHGNYDGQYYSMGRASQAIGGSSVGGRRSAGGVATGSPPTLLASSGPSGLLSRLLGQAGDLDSLLQPALGLDPSSPLATSDSGPSDLLSQLLGVPNDLDSLVRVAMGESDRDSLGSPRSDDPVESVSFTVRSDDSDSSEPRVIVEAEVFRDPAFDGKPALQVRFVAGAESGDLHAADRPLRKAAGRSALGYRPTWTPVLVRTPEDLAEQMRLHWRDAMAELDAGVDPRMTTFLIGMREMEAALSVLRSSQSSTSKFVLLQRLMDPDGPIQFQGLGLDAATFAAQIRIANEGDEAALGWLESVQREHVLTSFAEVTGTSLAAAADFRLTRWKEQGEALIQAVTMKADDARFDFNFSIIRLLLTTRAETQARLAESRAALERTRDSNPAVAAALQSLSDRLDQTRESPNEGRTEYGLLEDWFFEETKDYLMARFRQTLPGQFAAALTPASGDGDAHVAIAEETRRMAVESSVDLGDYAADPTAARKSGRASSTAWLRETPKGNQDLRRRERIVQAVRRAITDAETAGDDDLGTLVVAQEVLGYALWKREGLRADKQSLEADRQRQAAAQRSSKAQERAAAAELRDTRAREHADAARGVEQFVQGCVDALARASGSLALRDPLPESVESAARARIDDASAWETAAGDRLSAAGERERWAEAEEAIAATPIVRERLRAERDAAAAEQSDAKAERQAAKVQAQAARSDLQLIAEARAKLADLIRPVREENDRRMQTEAERQRQEMARQTEERRRRSEEQRQEQAAERERREAANQRQEQINQSQQDRARVAKDALAPQLEQLLRLSEPTPFWRRKARASLEQAILTLQTDIVAPLVPPRTRTTTWPSMLARTERYLGTVKKVTDYGAFVSLPAGADGLLRGSEMSTSLFTGQLVIVEISDIPHGKPIVLQLITR